MERAGAVRFNSAYHMRSWFDELPRLLRHFPDYTHLESIETTRAKSAVLPLGCDLQRLDRYHFRSRMERHRIDREDVGRTRRPMPRLRSARRRDSPSRRAFPD